MDLPSGVINYRYAQDIAIVRTKTQWGLLALLLVFLFTAPIYLPRYVIVVLNGIGITTIAALGLGILLGYCGQISIGHTAFMAVGAYTSAFLTSTLGVPFLIALIAAGVCAGLVGVVFGIGSLRAKGLYLAMATLAAQFIIIFIIKRWGSVTGGTSGTAVAPASIGGWTLETEQSYFYLIISVAIIATIVAKNISRTKAGRAFIAIRDNDLAAAVMGINIFTYKLLAFFISCFYAGIAGSLLAHYSHFIAPEHFTLNESIMYVGIVIIGGLGTTLGPILGTVFIRALGQGILFMVKFLSDTFPQWAASFPAAIGPIVFGVALAIFLIFEPRGLAHRWALFKSAYRLWPFSY